MRQVVALVLRGLHRFAADTSKTIDVDASSGAPGSVPGEGYWSYSKRRCGKMEVG